MKNRNCIIRLSRYKTALYRLKALGFVKVFSDNLAEAIGVMPSQVRKDFSLFGISGKKRGGYHIDALIERLNEILGKDKVHTVIIVGCGHIGSALMKYRKFEDGGIKIAAGFDIDPAKHAQDADIPVFPIDRVKPFIKEHNVELAIIAVPDIAAQQVADMLISAGIKGILNFAPIRLRCPEGSIAHNINLELELENLIYFVNVLKKKRVNPDETENA
ncbi:MAG: redox-sensing transcriptional repressor Rex [Candidatus Omnitrophica bacterium]|nr:redox-sensing transcriptional repressor Rex [Candidatus Omnitrophota bacterium]